MSQSPVADPNELMAQHLAELKTYARRVLLHDEVLTQHEEDDRQKRLREVLAMGNALGLTEREVALRLYQEVFESRPRARCWCLGCRGRWSPAPE